MKFISLIVCVVVGTVGFGQKSGSELMTAMVKSDKLMGQGVKSLEKKRYKKARSYFESALEENEWCYDAQSYLGVLYYFEKQPEQAIESFQKGLILFDAYKEKLATEKKQLLEKVNRSKMDALRIGGEQGVLKARPFLRQIEVIESEMKEDQKMTYPSFFRFKYGNALYMMNRVNEAKQQFQTIVHDDPKFKDVYANLTLCWFAEGNQDEALACYKKGKELGTKFHPDLEKQLKQLEDIQ